MTQDFDDLLAANRRFAELGVEQQARVILADYRDLPAEKFDRVVCIEAVERVEANQIIQLLAPVFDTKEKDKALHGL